MKASPLASATLLALALAVLPPALRADDPPQRATRPSKPSQTGDDADLMEFLGGIGSEDDEWIDYLAHADPTKVAAAPKRVPAVGASSPAADPPDGSRQK